MYTCLNIRPRLLFAILPLLVLSMPITGLAADQVSTLRDTLERVMTFNPQLEVSRQELIGSFEQVQQARSAFLPKIDFSASLHPYSLLSEGEDFKEGRTYARESLSIRQPVFSWFRSWYDHVEAEGKVEAEFFSYEEKEQDILGKTAQAYTAVLAQRIRQKLYESNLNQSQERAAAAEERFRLGDLNKPDLALAVSEFAKAQADLLSANLSLEEQEQALADLSGVRLASYAEFPDFSERIDLVNEETFLEDVRKNHPSLKSLRQLRKVAQQRYRQSQVTPLPLSISLLGQAQWQQEWGRDPSLSRMVEQSYSISAEATLPLYEGGRSGSLRRQARTARDSMNSRYQAQEREVVRQSRIHFRRWQDRHTLLDSVHKEVEAYKQLLDSYEAGAQLGLNSNLEVLEARRGYLNAQHKFITTRSQIVETSLGLLSALGLFTAEALEIQGNKPALREIYRSVRWRFDYFE